MDRGVSRAYVSPDTDTNKPRTARGIVEVGSCLGSEMRRVGEKWFLKLRQDRWVSGPRSVIDAHTDHLLVSHLLLRTH